VRRSGGVQAAPAHCQELIQLYVRAQPPVRANGACNDMWWCRRSGLKRRGKQVGRLVVIRTAQPGEPARASSPPAGSNQVSCGTSGLSHSRPSSGVWPGTRKAFGVVQE